MAAGWITALKLIPWDDVVANAPAVLRGAKKLWGKAGRSEPTPDRVGEMAARQKVLVNIDQTSRYRKSQENPDILRLYDEYYGEPNSDTAHHLLHTSYAPFRVEPIVPTR